jgi:multidrug efflux system outer membrane protein
MATKLIPPLTALLFCGGCNLIPEYRQPAPPVPQAWPAADAGPGVAPDLHWQEYFSDPKLQALIRLALDNNRDLRATALNVERAQALYRIQRGGLYPTVGVQAAEQRYRVPERMDSKGQGYTYSQNTVQIGVLSWELDFFGRIQSLKDQALNQYLATEQARSAAQIALVAAVAQGYFGYAADSQILLLAEATLASQQANHELVSRRRDAGIASDLELLQSRSQVDSARADAARFRGLVAQDRNALDLLAGTAVSADLLPERLDAAGELEDVSAGLPSEVLLRRPDILAAEYQLKAAYGNIGAARAAFFPSVSLTAGAGTMSPDVGHLFASGTRTWTFAPTIAAPIFAGGSLKANLKAAELTRDIAVAQYEKAIQSAFREVADGLSQRAALGDQAEAQRSLVEALDGSYQLAQARYRAGLDGYLNVLVAQRSLYAAQQGLVATDLAQRASRISLFKALGGQM